MTIKAKIIFITVLGLFVLGAILGSVSVKYAEGILTKKSYDSLISQRDSKAQQLKSFFDERVVDMNVLVEGSDVKNMSTELIEIHEHLEMQLKESHDALDSELKEKTTSYDKFFQNYIREYDYYNALLMDKEDGHIIYSTVKDIDYIQSISAGSLKNTNLSELWRKVIKLERTVFVDMRPFGSAGKTPAMFLGTPVYVDGVFKSIMVFHITANEINNIMKFREGYGDSQEDYLVGQDKLMRSDSFLAAASHSIESSLSNKSMGMVDTLASRNALLGKSGIEVIKDYRGNLVLSAYAPVEVGEDLTWAIISEIDEEEVMVPLDKFIKDTFLLFIVLLLIISVLVYIAVNINIILPLNDFQDGLIDFFKYLNREKSEVLPLHVKFNDEIGDMARVVNENIINTKSLIVAERELSKHDQQVTEDLKKIVEKDEKERWVKDGIAQLHEKLSGDLSVSDVSNIAITHLGNYLNAAAGVVYIFDSNKKVLNINASYAYVPKEESVTGFKLGEGTVGQVALQRLPMLIKGVHHSGLMLETGMLSEKPLNVYTFPLMFKGELYGVIEIGSSELFSEISEDFFESSNLVISTALATASQNQKVKDLLEDVKLTNIKMQEQQQKLEESNAQMEEQQQQLEESNAQMEEHRQQLEEQNDSLIKSQNMLDQKARDLIQSNKYKSEFLANMSHELRTPLNSIILLSDMLQENQTNHLDKDEVKKAKVINSSGNDLLNLIGDVLDLSKIEAGMMDLIVDNIDSFSLCKNFQDQFEEMAKHKELEFITIDEYRGEILNDKDRLSQVLRNLISNALKFTKEGSITMKIENSDDERVKISVIDTGIGIAEDKIETIFEAFKQADGTTCREYGGTGLGLSISLELIKMMHGDISLESKENEGSIFSIIIPNIDEASQEKLIKSKIETESDVEDDRDALKPDDRPFLIIEDDKVFANILKDKINLQGEYALIASSGEKGLNLAKEYDIKGVLLDLGLPDMDGMDLLKELKTDMNLRKIPVYVISGDKRVELSKEYGAKGFVKKPITDDEITSIIDEIKTVSDEIDIFMSRVNAKNNKDTKDTLDLKSKKVLIVDDDIRNIYVLLEALSSKGADVITASNGKEAIDVLKNNLDTDIVLMDIMMPVMDGYEAASLMKEDSSIKDIPIIAVTAKAMSDDREKTMDAGFDEYITKPLQMSLLSSIIEVLIKK